MLIKLSLEYIQILSTYITPVIFVFVESTPINIIPDVVFKNAVINFDRSSKDVGIDER